MCRIKKVLSEDDKIDEITEGLSEDSDEPEYVDSDSDSSTTDDADTSLESTAANQGSADEDELIKRIREERINQRAHPPMIHCDDWITDISFHPDVDVLAVGSITGDVALYKYANEGNTLMNTLELHMDACRGVEFNIDGTLLFSTSRDKAIMLSDVESGNLVRCYENAHDEAIYSLKVLDENIFATGDDDGVVKLWDIRENPNNSIFKMHKNEDYISDFASEDTGKHLVCSSGDGKITTIDLQQRKYLMQSEALEEEFTCMGIFRSQSKLIVGTTKGQLIAYNWSQFGLHSDIFPVTKVPINSLIPITENIVVTAGEDGILRAVHLFPHRVIGVAGQHDMAIENLDISNNGSLIASTCHNNNIKFWNIEYFEDFCKYAAMIVKNARKREADDHNLPSSKRQNVADFFSDM